MGKRVKLGNFWCTITSYEEIWQEMDERERFFKESIERHKLMKEKEKYFGLRPETDEQAESGNFSEEENYPNADEGLVRWTLEELNRMNGIPNENELTKEETREIFSRYNAEQYLDDSVFDFSEEQVNTEELEHWKESEAEKIESLEEADKRRSKTRGNK